MTTDIATLGLAVDANPVVKARDELGRFTKAAGEAEDGADKLKKKTSALAEAAKLLASAYASWKVAEHIRDMAMLAARYETLGVVMRIAGNNAGYTGAQMLAFQKQLEKTGISMTQSRNSLIQMATATIDLSKATQLARASQDLAVVGNLNSSEALERMVKGIQSGELEILKTMGMNVQWEAGYAKLASQLGKNKDALTEQEKVMSRTNTVLQDATKFTGIYEEAMGTAGKAINSLTRYWEDLKLKAGEAFLPTLTDSVFRLTEALKLANAEANKMGGSDGVIEKVGKGLAAAFDWAFTKLSIRAQQIKTVFEVVGNYLGGLAAQAVALAQGDTKAFVSIGKDMETQFKSSMKALEVFEERIKQATVTTKTLAKATEDAQAAAAAAEAKRIAAGEAERKRQEAETKALKAAEEAKAARQSILDGDIAALKFRLESEKAMRAEALADVAELNRQGLANDTQLYAAKHAATLQAATDQVTVYNAEIERLKKFQAKDLNERVQNNNKIKELEREKAEVIRKSLVEARQLQVAYAYDSNKAIREAQTLAASEIDSILAQTAALHEQNEVYGKLPATITAVNVARLEAHKIALEENEGTDWEIANTQRKIEALKQLQKEQGKAAELGKWTEIWKSIDSAAQTTFVNIFNGGKNAFDRLRDTLKSGLLDLLYQMTVKKWIFNIGASISGEMGLSSAAQAANGLGSASGANGITSMASLFQVGKGVYSAINSGFAGIETMIADAIDGTMYATGMSSNIASTSSFASGAGAVGSAAAGLVGGHYLGNAISGQYGIGDHGQAVVNTGAAVGAVIGSIIPVLGTALGAVIGGALGGLANRLFGMGSTEVKGTTLTGSFGANGFSGNTNTSLHQDGGWFRSDKNWTESPAIDSVTAKAFTDGYKALQMASAGFAKTLGADASSIMSRTQELNITLTKDAVANEKAVADFFASVGDAMARELVPSLQEFTKANETASATLQRLAGDYQVVDLVLRTIGRTSESAFGAVGVASLKAREQLIDLAGGLGNLTSGTAYFAQNFLTDAERMAPIIEDVRKQLTALGLAGVQTDADFKKAVLDLTEGGKLATEESARQYAALLQLAPQFKQMTDYTSSLTQATVELAAAQRTATEIAQERAGIERQIFDLTHNANEILLHDRQLELAAIDASNRPRQEYLNSLKDEAAAVAAAAQATAQAAAVAAAAAAAFEAQRADLQNQYDDLTMTPAQLLAKQRSSILEGNRALFDSIAKLRAEKDLRAQVTTAYESEMTAIKGVIGVMSTWSTSLRAQKDSMLLGNLSPLSSGEKYKEARMQYEQTFNAALSGDEIARSNYQGALTAFLTASQVANASDPQYQRDFARTQRDLNEAIKWAERNVDVGQASLSVLKQQVSSLSIINESVLSVTTALHDLTAAASGTSTGTTSSGSPLPVLDYATMGTLSMAPLADEVKNLRALNETLVAEVKGLRTDLERHTASAAVSTFIANDKAADKIVAGSVDAASRIAYGSQKKTVA